MILPRFLKKYLLAHATPKYEEYIRIVDGMEMKFDFFILPKVDNFSKKTKRIIKTIENFKPNSIIYLNKEYEENRFINSLLTYKIIKIILKKYGYKLENLGVGIDNLTLAKRNGLLYQIANDVEVIFTNNDMSIGYIEEELLREYGVLVINIEDKKHFNSICEILFNFEESYCKSNIKNIAVYPEEGVIEDNLFLQNSIYVENILFAFNPLRDISIFGEKVFENLNIKVMPIICKKILYKNINSLSDVINIWTKDYFYVKIPLILNK